MDFVIETLPIRVTTDDVVFGTTYRFIIKPGRFTVKLNRMASPLSDSFWAGKVYEPKTVLVGEVYLPETVLT